MQVDDARQHFQAACVNADRTASMVQIDRGNFAARDRKRGFEKFAAEQCAAAFDENIGHDRALRRGVRERAGMLAASYFARNSSTPTCRKPASPLRKPSSSQPHHPSLPTPLAPSS